eukprot:6196059-Pleurochrysis_carterae.AAC.1
MGVKQHRVVFPIDQLKDLTWACPPLCRKHAMANLRSMRAGASVRRVALRPQHTALLTTQIFSERGMMWASMECGDKLTAYCTDH